MIEVVPFEMKHFDSLQLRELERVTTAGILDRLKQNAVGSGPAYTGLVNGEAVAIAGVAILWDGVGEGWIFGSPQIQEHKQSFCRHVLRKLRVVEKEHKLWRIQAHIVSGWSGLMRFVEVLGFRVEGRLTRYGPHGEDYLIYARINHG